MSGIFQNLHKWASSQDENFTTEILIYIISESLILDAEYAIYLLDYISGSFICANDIDDCIVSGQYSTKYGVPDLVIEAKNKIVFVEVKVDSDFGDKQISRYRKAVELQTKESRLITLTRYILTKSTVKEEMPDISITWDNLSELFSIKYPNNSNIKYLVKEYIHYLKYRGLAMEKVKWQLIEGVAQIKNLMAILSEAISHSTASISQSSNGKDWAGYYLDGSKLFIGLYYDEPEKISINTECALLENASDIQIEGRFENNKWWWDLPLTDEDVHFFSRTKASQIEVLTQFINNSVINAKQTMA